MNGNGHDPDEQPLNLEGVYAPSKDMSIEQLQHLVQLLDRSDVSEIELKRIKEGTRLVLRKAKASESVDMQTQQVMLPLSSPAKSTETTSAVETTHRVVAPLVGIFHTSAKPKGGTLVAVGDIVKTGQLVGTIQSLNVMNEVETSKAGRVVDILVQEGQAVEYGQHLMTIDSAEGA
ncbi:MAG: acetyl-CoA carboxylase biotin carboxyl carrier protein [Ktedonobacteraceae bacterium]